MEGRELALLSTKRLSAASSRDALSASAWDPYGHFYPWEPSWDQRGSDPLFPPQHGIPCTEVRPSPVPSGTGEPGAV